MVAERRDETTPVQRRAPFFSRRLLTMFGALFLLGLWQPAIGGTLITALLGLLGLRLVANGYRRLYRWAAR